MIKLVFCLRRLPHLTREEFQDYWLNRHAPLAKSFQHLVGNTRYVQMHTVSSVYDEALRAERGAPEPYDGITESWWESWEALQKALSNPDAQKAFATLLEDEKKFIDLKNSPVMFGVEREIT